MYSMYLLDHIKGQNGKKYPRYECGHCGHRSIALVKERKIVGQGYKILEWAQERMDKGLCPVCGKSKSEWEHGRRKFCGHECDNHYFEECCISYNWNDIRRRILKRDNYICKKCGAQTNTCNSDHYIIDHIFPIALGGDEFDYNNLQTLCPKCNRVKINEDIKKISELRNLEKNNFLSRFQTKLTVD